MQLFKRFMGQSIVFVAVLALCSFTAFAQRASGSLRGQVVDEFGGLIVGATIRVADARGVEKTATTDREGAYIVAGLAPGVYTVRATAPGFAMYENAGVEIAAGRRDQLNITLGVTVEAAEVTVAREAPISTEVENNANALVLRGADLDALPDDPDDLAAALQALAGPSAGPNGGQFFIDGFTGGRLPPKESIREIRINQNPFSAEYDRLGFGRVEIFTRPGTDRLRGQAFLSFRDESLNSRDPFARNRAPYQLRSYGGNLSGPVIAKKASFFLDFEHRDIAGNAVVNALILDASLNPTLFNQAFLVPQRRTTFSPRFDYQLNQNNTLVGRYTYTRGSIENFGISEFSLPERAYNTANTEHTMQLTETAVINQKVINETRFQFIRSESRQEGDNSRPTIQVLQSFTGGGSSIGLSSNDQDRFELQNYTSWVMGRHALKAGGRVRYVNITDQSQQNFNGTFVFTSLEQYRQVLLGAPGVRPTQFTINGGEPQAQVSQTDFGAFAQDDWRLRPNFTLSLGLRYETQNNIDSNLNFAPRVSFAWSPGGGGTSRPKMVLRGGFGVFYDRFREDLTLQANRLNGTNQLQFIVPNPDFFPTVKSAATLRAEGLQQNIQTVRHVAEDLQSPYTMQAAISVERQLPRGFTLAVTYLNARTVHALRSRNINTPLPGTFNPDLPGGGPNVVRPFGNIGNIFQYESTGFINENRLIVSINNRFGQKFTIFGNYSLGSVKSDTFDANNFPANSYDLSGEYGRSPLDIRHRMFLGGNITAPWDIRINPFIIAFSGRPFNITIGRDLNGDALFTERPAFATDLNRSSVRVTPFGAFDLRPLPGQEIIPRNYGQGPAFFSVNLRVGKTFSFGELPSRSGAASAPAQPGGGERAAAGGPGVGGGRGPGGPGGGGAGGGGRGGANPFGQGPGGFFGGGSAEKRYSLTFSVQVQNLFNRTNAAPPIGNLSSPLFGLSNQAFGGFGGFGAGAGGGEAGNRRVEAQLRFSF